MILSEQTNLYQVEGGFWGNIRAFGVRKLKLLLEPKSIRKNTYDKSTLLCTAPLNRFCC